MASTSADNLPPAAPAPDNASPTATSPSWGRIELLIALALALWVVFLHFTLLLHAGPLWRDETNLINAASLPTLADIWRHLQFDYFPPLFVTMAHAWTLAGASDDFSFRILGFLIGMATLGIVWFAARVCGGRVPLLALALYAANPMVIRIGDSMRPYGLGAALGVLTLALTWKFVETSRARNLFWATFAAVLSVQCLFQNAWFIVAFSAGAWAVTISRKQWKTAAQTLVIGVVAAVSLLPHVGNIIKSRPSLVIRARPVDFHEIWLTLENLLDAPRRALPGSPAGSVSAFWFWLWVVLAVVAVFVAIYYAIRAPQWNMVYCATALVVGATLHLFFLRALHMPPRPWYYLVLLAPTALAVDALLGSLKIPALRIARAGLALVLVALSAAGSEARLQSRQTNADLIAAALKGAVQPHDMILVAPWYYAVSLQRYFGTNGLNPLPPMSELRMHRYDLLQQQMEAQNPIGPVMDKARQTLQSGHALWVVGNLPSPPPGMTQWVLPPYRGGLPGAEGAYMTSWTFQVARILDAHTTNSSWADIPVPDGPPALEDIPVFVYRGWKEQ